MAVPSTLRKYAVIMPHKPPSHQPDQPPTSEPMIAKNLDMACLRVKRTYVNVYYMYRRIGMIARTRKECRGEKYAQKDYMGSSSSGKNGRIIKLAMKRLAMR